MGVGDVPFLNDGWVQTPNIDRLARTGIVVENYYTAAAVSLSIACRFDYRNFFLWNWASIPSFTLASTMRIVNKTTF